MRISDWSSDVCSSDLTFTGSAARVRQPPRNHKVQRSDMRILLCTTGLTSAALLAAFPAIAKTKIETKITTPVATSTAHDAAPDDIEITDKGSVVPTGGTAVTLARGTDLHKTGTSKISHPRHPTAHHPT